MFKTFTYTLYYTYINALFFFVDLRKMSGLLQYMQNYAINSLSSGLIDACVSKNVFNENKKAQIFITAGYILGKNR